MIGNDIIDIAETLGSSKQIRPDFIKKVFTEKEQYFISDSNNPELMICLLWSMKESAYKIYIRQLFERTLSPLRFHCKIINTNESSFSGEVNYKGNAYTTYSTVSNDSISTIAFIKDIFRDYQICHKDIKCSNKDYRTQHNEIYYSAVKNYSKISALSPSDLSIKKDNYGIPHFYYKSSILQIPISLSHHGYYASYAIAVKM